MATVPGPQPGGPLPIPGAPGEEPVHEPVEEPGSGDPYHGDEPDWIPRPYEPGREKEFEEFAEPVAP
jgi:hypothetical protein